jgi:hypothetical protein
MVQQRPLNSPLRDAAFVFMQSYRAGVKQVDGGIALAMASTDLMIKHVLSGAWRLHLLER